MYERNYFFRISVPGESLAMIDLKLPYHPIYNPKRMHSLEEIALAAVEKYALKFGGLDGLAESDTYEVLVWDEAGVYLGQRTIRASRVMTLSVQSPTAVTEYPGNLEPQHYSHFGSWTAHLCSMADLRVENAALKKSDGEMKSKNEQLQMQLDDALKKLHLFRLAQANKSAILAQLDDLRAMEQSSEVRTAKA